MRVAIPTKNGSIIPMFHKANEFTIYDVEIELVMSKTLADLGSRHLGDFLLEESINAVICGRIHSSLRNVLRMKRVELTYGVSGQADDVMVRYLSGERLGNLEENTLWHFEEGERE